MATTLSVLQGDNNARICQVLAFEGYNLLVSTEDAAGIATAWAATDWTTVKAGLDITGKTSQEIVLFEGATKPDTLTFEILDYDGSLLSMFRAAYTETARNWLDTNIDSNDTSIPLDSVTDFAASGNAFIGTECLGYTSKTGAPDETLNSATRGKFSLFGTSSDATRFGRPHRMRDTGNPGQHQSPVVTDAPQTWYGRGVSLYFHHYENGAWSTKANAYNVWSGTIESWKDLGDGKIQIVCTSVLASLKTRVFSNQLRGRLEDGVGFDEDLTLRCSWSATGGYYSVEATVTATGTVVGWQEFAELINAELENTINVHADVTAESHRWALEMVQVNNEWRMSVRVRDSAAIGGDEEFYFRVYGTPAAAVMDLLGFDTPYLNPSQSFNSNTARQIHAPKSPIVYYAAGTYGDATTAITVESGEWINQPARTLPKGTPADAVGLMKIGDVVVAVTEPSGSSETSKTFNIKGWYSADTGTVSTNFSALEEMLGAGGAIRLGQADRAPEVCQVWLQHGPADVILLQLLLSTGTSGYNHATLDVYGYGLGLGLPYTLIDVDSFQSCLRPLDPFSLILTEPTPFVEILECLLAATNHYLVWRNGKIAIVSPGLSSPYQAGIPHLTEDNKAAPADSDDPQRTVVEYGALGIINQVTLEYDMAFDGTYRKRKVAESTSSVTDHRGKLRSVRVKGRGIMDSDYWLEHVAMVALEYFARAPAVATRSIDFNMAATLSPGMAVIVDDNSVIDPRTGERGIEDFPAWVLGVDFDWTTGTGEVRLVFLPNINWTRAGTWSPCAQVAIGTTFGSATTALICEDHRFSHSSESVDAAAFITNDLVRIFPIDETGPTDFLRQVASVSSSTINLTASVTLTSGKTYVIEPQDTTAIDGGGNTSQFDHAFLAENNGTVTDGVEDGAPYLWLHNATTIPYDSIDYTKEYVRMDSVADDDGEPFSVRKVFHCVESLNNIYGVKTCPVLVRALRDGSLTSTSLTGELVFGPAIVPWYAPIYFYGMTRALKFRVFGSIANAASTATFTLKACAAPVTGTSSTALTYPGSVTSASVTTQSTSLTWIAEGTLSLPIVSAGSGVAPPFTWLTLEHKTSNASHAVGWGGLIVREAALGE